MCANTRTIAHLNDIDPTRVGAKSFRIGGAFLLREWCERNGVDAERLLKERGRWHTDIGFIYARMSDRTHLAASAGVAVANGGTSTEANTGWAQPAR